MTTKTPHTESLSVRQLLFVLPVMSGTGEEYYAKQGLQARDVVMLSFAFVIEEELERQTEGLLIMTQFPINYFTVADLDQRFDEFRDHFHRWTGVELSGTPLMQKAAEFLL